MDQVPEPEKTKLKKEQKKIFMFLNQIHANNKKLKTAKFDNLRITFYPNKNPKKKIHWERSSTSHYVHHSPMKHKKRVNSVFRAPAPSKINQESKEEKKSKISQSLDTTHDIKMPFIHKNSDIEDILERRSTEQSHHTAHTKNRNTSYENYAEDGIDVRAILNQQRYTNYKHDIEKIVNSPNSKDFMKEYKKIRAKNASKSQERKFKQFNIKAFILKNTYLKELDYMERDRRIKEVQKNRQNILLSKRNKYLYK
ncbi:unnamed protein product [Moneuplotes crassus]|uniref:Uncharacterized protein n=1 Tax=Euplotes crassus TaxID=5936 RepID=A0AAD1XME9_EUPCR|nr:unnamed protein product [Moneuplotes crassus]